MPVLYVLIGAPGAGKTTTAKRIMDARRTALMQGKVLGAAHPDGDCNKKGVVKQIGCGCVLDGSGGAAFLGRYAAFHNKLARPEMEGADRLQLGKETDTWSHMLRPGVSVLARYKVLVVDSCDATKSVNAAHLLRVARAGWDVRVRELQVGRDASAQRCRARNYNGDGGLTEVELRWHDSFDAEAIDMRAKFRQWTDFKVCTQDAAVSEALLLAGGGGTAAPVAAAGVAGPAAATSAPSAPACQTARVAAAVPPSAKRTTATGSTAPPTKKKVRIAPVSPAPKRAKVAKGSHHLPAAAVPSVKRSTVAGSTTPPAKKKARPHHLSPPRLKKPRGFDKAAEKFDVEDAVRRSPSHEFRVFMGKARNNHTCRMCSLLGNRGAAHMFCRTCRRNLCLTCWNMWHGLE